MSSAAAMSQFEYVPLPFITSSAASHRASFIKNKYKCSEIQSELDWYTPKCWRLIPVCVLFLYLIILLSQVKDFGQSATAKAKASGFYKKLTSRSMVEFGHFLWDVIIVLSKLSLALQRRDISIAEVSDQVDGVMAVLVKYGEEWVWAGVYCTYSYLYLHLTKNGIMH